MLHALLGLTDLRSLNTHPKSGASWEGFVLETIVDRLGLPDERVNFWATHTGAELDLVVARGRRRIGIEIKRTTTRRVTRALRSALSALDLSEAIVVHAGGDSYRLADGVRAVAARRMDADLGI